MSYSSVGCLGSAAHKVEIEITQQLHSFGSMASTGMHKVAPPPPGPFCVPFPLIQ